MGNFRTGCVVCGREVNYSDELTPLKCDICGEAHESNMFCERGHYICDKCHAKNGLTVITELAVAAASENRKNPFEIAEAMMKSEKINMHGPEHHYLVAAALLAAYKSAGGDIDLNACLEKAFTRAKNVPGGICGMWGSCGAGVGSGIFVSVITGATSLSGREWGLSNLMTARSLENVAKHGGPRCCKRNTYLAIDNAVDFIKEHFDVSLDRTERVTCVFSHMNKQCRREACLYWNDSAE